MSPPSPRLAGSCPSICLRIARQRGISRALRTTAGAAPAFRAALAPPCLKRSCRQPQDGCELFPPARPWCADRTGWCPLSSLSPAASTRMRTSSSHACRTLLMSTCGQWAAPAPSTQRWAAPLHRWAGGGSVCCTQRTRGGAWAKLWLLSGPLTKANAAAGAAQPAWLKFSPISLPLSSSALQLVTVIEAPQHRSERVGGRAGWPGLCAGLRLKRAHAMPCSAC